MKVDLFDENEKKWGPGVIDKVERLSENQLSVTAKREDAPEGISVTVVWPDERKISFCGEKYMVKKIIIKKK